MILSRVPLFMMVLLSVTIALASFRFLGLGLEQAFTEMPDHIAERRLVFLMHVTFSPLALVFGSMQLIPRLRAKRPVLHRWTGRLYGVSVLLGGVSGLVVAYGAAGGIAPQTGFGLLAVLWLITTAQGIRFARARDFKAHRRWMIRSFALTFAAVTLRIYLPFFLMNGFSYNEASAYVAWMCWVPNLIVVEWWMRRQSARATIR